MTNKKPEKNMQVAAKDEQLVDIKKAVKEIREGLDNEIIPTTSDQNLTVEQITTNMENIHDLFSTGLTPQITPSLKLVCEETYFIVCVEETYITRDMSDKNNTKANLIQSHVFILDQTNGFNYLGIREVFSPSIMTKHLDEVRAKFEYGLVGYPIMIRRHERDEGKRYNNVSIFKLSDADAYNKFSKSTFNIVPEDTLSIKKLVDTHFENPLTPGE